MPRPQKSRRICALPQTEVFGPLYRDATIKKQVEMTVDEYETIRLIDLEGYTQEECAQQMAVARTTVQAIYETARHKIADALVNSKELLIRGGAYKICDDAFGCHRQCCRRHGAPGNPCRNEHKEPDLGK